MGRISLLQTTSQDILSGYTNKHRHAPAEPVHRLFKSLATYKHKVSFEWNSSPCHAPQNHPGKRSSLHCLPSRKRQAEKTSGLIEPETKLHIRIPDHKGQR